MQTPFFLTYGQHPWKGTEPIYKMKSESAKEFADRIKQVRDYAAAALEKAKAKIMQRYNLQRREAPKFEVEMKVYIKAENIKQAWPSKKLSDQYIGPYRILEKRGESSSLLDLPSTDMRYPVFNEELLLKYHEPLAH